MYFLTEILTQYNKKYKIQKKNNVAHFDDYTEFLTSV